MVDVAELNIGELRLLETDNRIVLPVGVAVRVLVTSVMYCIVELFRHSQLRLMRFLAIKPSYFINYKTWCILWSV